MNDLDNVVTMRLTSSMDDMALPCSVGLLVFLSVSYSKFLLDYRM